MPLIWWIIGGAIAVGTAVAVASSSSSDDTSVKDFSKVQRLFPHTPPIPPYYAPNIHRAKYPLCWTAVDGDWTPSEKNSTATDVTGTPFIAFKICKGVQNLGMGGGVKCEGSDVYGHTLQSLSDETLGEVWDIEKRTWRKVDDSLVGTWQWYQAEWSGEPDWIDRLGASVKHFIPIVVGIAVSVIATPLAGAITAAALEAIIAIADGAPVSDALVQSYKDQLATEVEKTSYYKTYTALATNFDQTKDSLQKIRQSAIDTYMKASTLPPATAEKRIAAAVDTGIAVARAKILQDAAYVAVRSRLPHDLPDGSDYRPWFDLSMAHGVTLNNWTIAMFGEEGVELLRWAYKVAGEALDAGKDPNEAVKPLFVLLPAKDFEKIILMKHV